jgi:hypothetical protein
MTLRMLDSITVGNLPPGADAYLGYVDGYWPTFAALGQAFPHAQLLSMTVQPGYNADACDCENGDLTPADVPGWVKRQLARGQWRPVVYANASTMPGVLADLDAAGVARSSVRLLTAHYDGEHICGPGSCGTLGPSQADGTQWRETAPGMHGTEVDESMLEDDFFETTPGPVLVSWVTAGLGSLVQLAADQHTSPAAIIRGTVQHASTAQWGAFAAYLDQADLTKVMPKGLSLWWAKAA